MTAAAGPDKKVQVEQLLGDIFRLAEWPATLQLKDGADGGIAVAVHFSGEVPGVKEGKKSYLVDSLQFLVNKVVNRPNVEKRWVTLGVGGFPEPRPPQAAPAPVAAPVAQQPKALAVKNGAKGPKPSAPVPAREDTEAAAVTVSPEWQALGELLKTKAVKHGRHYAVMLLSAEERAQLLKAAAGEGLKVKAEGEGHFKRVALVPDKSTPMPRKMQFPDDEDDGDDDEG